jgi:hypothetical protein
MSKKTPEDIRLMMAQALNDENDSFARIIKGLSSYSDLTSAQQLLEALTFAHKEKVKLLEWLYREI